MGRMISSLETDPALLRKLEAAAKHVMTPAERYDQMVSWVYGETGTPKERIREVLAAQGHVRPEDPSS